MTRYLAFATDYDGTLATDGRVGEQTLDALKRLRETGRKLFLVTGRHLDDVTEVFPQVDWFDGVVAENGALVYFPATREELLLGDRPPEAFIQALRDRQVESLGIGKVIVSTWHPHETAVLETIRDLGLELQVIFNKGAVMVLPSGINKAVGLNAALTHLGLSPHNAVAIGDAENDHAFLETCEFSVAVANALPMVKERADWVTPSSRGAGVVELINKLVSSDLEEFAVSQTRHQILLGTKADKSEVYMPAYGSSLLLAGTSGGGKSTLATGIVERLAEEGYQFALIDPEGDYESLEGAVVLGDSRQPPNTTEILTLLDKPDRNVIINLLGVKLEERPAYFAGLLPSLLEMRSRTGRPHWLIVDEAHHLLPASWNPASITMPQALSNMVLITVHPDRVAVPALLLANVAIAVGQAPHETITAFCNAVGHCPPDPLPDRLEEREVLAWFRQTEEPPFRFQVAPPKTERRRHMRNYAEGELGEDKSFYFRGPEAKLNLRAQNLITFTQMAAGVDEDTWLYHLQRQDYSRWFQEAIKDETLAEEAAEIEGMSDLSATESRDRIKSAINRRYTLPA